MAEQARGMLSEGLTRFAECVRPEHLEAVAAVERVRALHTRQAKPVRSYGMDGYCAAHEPTGRGYWAPPADLRDCPDCRYTEYYVCSHCECPNDEWPCPTIRALEGEQ